MTGTALLLIDVQQGIIDLPVHDAAGLLQRLAALLDRARKAEVPVIHIQHQEDDLPAGTPGWEIHPAVAPAPGEPVVAKTECDSFAGTDLGARLAEAGVSHLVMAGLMTEWCVQTTVRRALDLGYQVTLVTDGHSTDEKEERTAVQMIAEVNRELTECGARPRRAADVSFG